MFSNKIYFLFQHAWSVAIVIEQDGGSKIHCSGSIIDEKTVLTAAHCFVNPEDPASVDFKKMKVIGRDLFLPPPFFLFNRSCKRFLAIFDVVKMFGPFRSVWCKMALAEVGVSLL